MARVQHKPLTFETFEEFLRWERLQDTKHDLVDGANAPPRRSLTPPLKPQQRQHHDPRQQLVHVVEVAGLQDDDAGLVFVEQGDSEKVEWAVCRVVRGVNAG